MSWITGWGKADNGRLTLGKGEGGRRLFHPYAADLVSFFFSLLVEIRNLSRHPSGSGGSYCGKQPVQMHLQ